MADVILLLPKKMSDRLKNPNVKIHPSHLGIYHFAGIFSFDGYGIVIGNGKQVPIRKSVRKTVKAVMDIGKMRESTWTKAGGQQVRKS